MNHRNWRFHSPRLDLGIYGDDKQMIGRPRERERVCVSVKLIDIIGLIIGIEKNNVMK